MIPSIGTNIVSNKSNSFVWNSDSSIISGLDGVGFNANIETFNWQGNLHCIIGDYYGTLSIRTYNGNTWNTNYTFSVGLPSSNGAGTNYCATAINYSDNWLEIYVVSSNATTVTQYYWDSTNNTWISSGTITNVAYWSNGGYPCYIASSYNKLSSFFGSELIIMAGNSSYWRYESGYGYFVNYGYPVLNNTSNGTGYFGHPSLCTIKSNNYLFEGNYPGNATGIIKGYKWIPNPSSGNLYGNWVYDSTLTTGLPSSFYSTPRPTVFTYGVDTYMIVKTDSYPYYNAGTINGYKLT